MATKSANGSSKPPGGGSGSTATVERTRARQNNAKREIFIGASDAGQKLLAQIVTPVKDFEKARELLASTQLVPVKDDDDMPVLTSALNRGLLQLAYAHQTAFPADTAFRDALVALHFVYEAAMNRVEEVMNAALRMGTGAVDCTTLVDALRPVLAQELHKATNSLAPSAAAATGGTGTGFCARELEAALRAQTDTLTAKFDALPDAVATKVQAATTLNAPLYSRAHLRDDPSNASGDRFAGRPREQQDAVGRADIQERQVLVDADRAMPAVAAWTRLSAPELVAKAKIALQKVLQEYPPKEGDAIQSLDDLAIHAVTPQPGSHAVFEFKTVDAAEWLRENARRASFQSGFSVGANVRLRVYNVILKNVPVAFDPANENDLRELERQNQLPELVIHAARWWKPTERRRPGQENAHLLVSFARPEWANYAIDQRLVYNLQSHEVERITPDPFRCAKCQRYGHLAVRCVQKETSCGTCGGTRHVSKECRTHEERHVCVNCTDAGTDARHAAWWRDCPSRLKQIDKMRARRPEDFAPHFLTSRNADVVFPRDAHFISFRAERVTQRAAKDARASRRSRSRSKVREEGEVDESDKDSTASASRGRRRSKSNAATSDAEGSSALMLGMQRRPSSRRASTSSARRVTEILDDVAHAN